MDALRVEGRHPTFCDLFILFDFRFVDMDMDFLFVWILGPFSFFFLFRGRIPH